MKRLGYLDHGLRADRWLFTSFALAVATVAFIAGVIVGLSL